MNKADYAILEKAFMAEVDAAISEHNIPGMIHGKSKRLLALVEQGYLQPCHWEGSDRLGKYTVSGYCLTLLGNATYCMDCT